MRESTKVLMDRFNDAKTAINSKYQIISFLNDHGIRIESNHQIRCPFHDDSTPSFSVNGQRNIWKCFGCPDGGHFLDLWIKYNNKFESTHHTVFSAVNEILAKDSELQKTLGFSSIYKSEETEFDLFKAAEEKSKETGYFSFDIILQKSHKITPIPTDSMHAVLKKCKTPEQIIQFITDCESGMSEEQLIEKYLKGQGDITNFIRQITSSDTDDIANELRGILNE